MGLEQAIRSLIDSNTQGIVEILGARGAGKTTALEHLAATLGSPDRLLLLDEPDVVDINSPVTDVLLIFTSCTHREAPTHASSALAPWTDDDVIEYLLTEHPSQCRSVMQRLQEDSFRRAIGGQPQLWRIVLDEMADDEALSEIRDALRCGVERWLGVIRHRAVRLLFAADRVVGMLRSGRGRDLPSSGCHHELIVEIGHLAQNDARTVKCVRRLLKQDVPNLHPIAASVLHAAGAEWRPKPKQHLAGAYLNGASWTGVDLSHAVLSQARLATADLSQANLHCANLSECGLVRASLRGARLVSARLWRVNLNGADLSNVNAESVGFRDAQLGEAVLRQAILIKANFTQANLSAADLCGADMSEAILVGTIVDGADFTNADLRRAELRGLALRNALLRGARFADARLLKCNLEFIEMPGADFARADLTGSWLTGTVMPKADFRRANLCAGLADIEWPGADLRDADLRGCSFHMGSSRSGLVGSPYPGHGSRTGFYTDTYDRYYKSPEEIRTANLTRADLRGADVRGVDFYLVDLRGAIYHHDQARHFQQCDAILEDWDEGS